jgi:hypothetical protein
MFDLSGLKTDIESAATKSGDFVEVPHGDYEVKISKIELGEVTNETSANYGMPKVSVWFTILAGEFKNQKIFMTQLVHKGFGIHKMNEFLTSLESGVPVLFENYVQYDNLLNEIFNAIDGTAEYQLSYIPNAKNPKFSEYVIVQRFHN